MKKISMFIASFLVILGLSGCTLLDSNEDTDYGIDESIPTTQITTSYSEAYTKVFESCVGIRNLIGSTGARIGSGIILKVDTDYTYVLTNRHVIEDEDETKVGNNISVYFGNNIYVSATIVSATSHTDRMTTSSKDLALLKFKTQGSLNVKAVTLGDDILAKGQDVLAVGCPMSLLYFNTLSVGVVSKLHSTDHLVQHSAPINPGNSGGGLFNLAGRLIGLNVSKLATDDNGDIIENMNFAIDMGQIRSFLSSSSFEI